MGIRPFGLEPIVLEGGSPMDKSVFFEGFQPTSEIRSKAKDFLWKVEEQSPGNSSHKVFFRKTPLGYHGEINIKSLAGVFKAEAESQDPNVVLSSLFAQICEDLSLWKKNRPLVG